METSSDEVADRARPAVGIPGADGPAVESASGWRPNSYLGILVPATREAFLGLGLRRVFAPGQIFIAEGDEDTDLFVLLEGIVKVTAKGVEGEDLFVDVQAQGDTVGELAAINPTTEKLPRTATVLAAGDVTAIRISKPDLDAFFAAHYDGAVAMAYMLGGRQRQKLRERLDMSGLDAAARLARTLVALEERLGIPTPRGTLIDIPLTQTELATLAVVAEPTVQKALRDLRRDGAIQTGYRAITITDRAALRRAGRLEDE
jgi:CRP/FNR family transcriptional regulator, cyclic AMP receptor protein